MSSVRVLREVEMKYPVTLTPSQMYSSKPYLLDTEGKVRWANYHRVNMGWGVPFRLGDHCPYEPKTSDDFVLTPIRGLDASPSILPIPKCPSCGCKMHKPRTFSGEKICYICLQVMTKNILEAFNWRRFKRVIGQEGIRRPA